MSMDEFLYSKDDQELVLNRSLMCIRQILAQSVGVGAKSSSGQEFKKSVVDRSTLHKTTWLKKSEEIIERREQERTS